MSCYDTFAIQSSLSKQLVVFMSSDPARSEWASSYRAIIVNANKQLVFQYGQTNVAGNGPNQLYGPYTRYVIGDYTGQTPPPPLFREPPSSIPNSNQSPGFSSDLPVMFF